MKNIFSFLLSIFLGYYSYSQNYSTILDKTWVCVTAKSPEYTDSLMKSWYVGNKLILSNNGTFKYEISPNDSIVTTRINGTFKISAKGVISFPSSTQTMLYNGKSSIINCIYDTYNTCMLTLNIKKNAETELILTISGMPNSEITKDMNFRYILK